MHGGRVKRPHSESLTATALTASAAGSIQVESLVAVGLFKVGERKEAAPALSSPRALICHDTVFSPWADTVKYGVLEIEV